MNLEEELRQLRIKESKASEAGDFELEVEIKLKRLEIEKSILLSLKNPKKKVKLFNPMNHKQIKAVSMEVIGKNYIPFIKGAYNILAGRGGSGKSAIALKSMLMWLKDNPNKTALAYFTEDGIEEIKVRARIICKNSNLDFNLIERISFISLDNDDRLKWVSNYKSDYVIKEDYIKELIDYCKLNKTEYIILDPLKRFHSVSENSNDDMDILVRDCFVKIAVETNSVLLVLHHSAKSGDGGGRGAGTITDTARIAWKIGRYYIQDKLTKEIVEVENKKGFVKLEVIKDNLGIEKFCSIRANHDKSIENPLSNTGLPTITEFNNDVNENNFMDNIAG